MELNRFSKKSEIKQTNIRRNILSFSSGSNPFYQKRSPTKPEEASKSVELEQVIVDILEEKVATKVIIILGSISKSWSRTESIFKEGYLNSDYFFTSGDHRE